MQLQPTTITLIFTAVTALGVLLQAFILLGIFIASKKAFNRFQAVSDELKTHAIPVLKSTREILEDITPKLKDAASNLAVASEQLRSQAENVNSAVGDIVEKTRLQADRVDGMVSGVLNAISNASQSVQRAVSGPMRQATGLFSGFRAGVDALLSRDRRSHAAEDKDLFV